MEGRRREEEKRDGREEEKRDERKEEKRDGRREEEQVTVLTKQPDLCDPPLPPPSPPPPSPLLPLAHTTSLTRMCRSSCNTLESCWSKSGW